MSRPLAKPQGPGKGSGRLSILLVLPDVESSAGWEPLRRLLRERGHDLGVVYANDRAEDVLVRRATSESGETDLEAMPQPAGVRSPPAHRLEALARMPRAGEHAGGPGRCTRRFLEEHRPDVLVVTPSAGSCPTQVDYVKAGRALGIPSVLCVADPDTLTTKECLGAAPDRVCVWNEAQREEAISSYGARPASVVVTGAPSFDRCFEPTPSLTREEFCLRVGLDPERPVVVYCGSPYVDAPAEVSFVERWIGRIRSADDPSLANVGILIRPHPSSVLLFLGLDLSQVENAAIWPPHGTERHSPDAAVDSFDCIYHSGAVVSVSMSSLLEAAAVGRPVCTMRAAELEGARPTLQHVGRLECAESGLLRVADDFAQHLRDIAAALADAGLDPERTRAFAAGLVRPYGIDRPSAPIVADEIERTASLELRSRRRGAHRVGRFLLLPVLGVRRRDRPPGVERSRQAVWVRVLGRALFLWILLRAYALAAARRLGIRSGRRKGAQDP